MYLKKLSLINFKNIREENLEFRPGINCFVGDNGAGKTQLCVRFATGAVQVIATEQ